MQVASMHFKERVGAKLADGTVLKSVVRSNPGFLVLKDGVVKGKFHYHDIPSRAKLEEML